jgi:hypothetical protein
MLAVCVTALCWPIWKTINQAFLEKELIFFTFGINLLYVEKQQELDSGCNMLEKVVRDLYS